MTPLRKLLSKSILLVLIIFLSFSFTSYAESDKTDSYYDVSGIENAEFKYDIYNDTTQIIWSIEIINNTICDFNGFSAKFNIYNESELLFEKSYTSIDYIKHGETFRGRYIFNIAGKADSIKLISFKENSTTFIETYKLVILMTAITVFVLTALYIILMLVYNFSFNNLISLIYDHFALISMISLFALLLGVLYTITAGVWISFIIILCGIASLIILICLAHFIKYKCINR